MAGMMGTALVLETRLKCEECGNPVSGKAYDDRRFHVAMFGIVGACLGCGGWLAREDEGGVLK